MTAGGRARVDILLAKSYDPDPRVRRTAEALIQAGHEVRVLAWDRSGKRPLDETDGRIPIRRIHVRSRASRGWTQIFFLLLVAFRVLPVLRQRRPDVLHAVNLPMLAVAIGLAPFVGGRPRIVYDAFEIHSLMGAHRYSDWLVGLIGIIERYLPRLADLVITPGEDRRRYFERLGIASVAIPNWIDPPSAVPDRPAARERLGIEPERFVVLYAGGIIGSRDLQPLIDHARHCPDDLVLVAGRGDAEDEVARAAGGLSNVRMLGWVPDPSDLLSASDALYYALKPDHVYAMHAAPNNLYQAVAYAIPLVYREQGEIAVVAAQYRIGRAFHDSTSLEAALEALRDPAENAAVRTDLRGLQDRFRWSRAAEFLVDAYGRVAPAAPTVARAVVGRAASGPHAHLADGGTSQRRQLRARPCQRRRRDSRRASAMVVAAAPAAVPGAAVRRPPSSRPAARRRGPHAHPDRLRGPHRRAAPARPVGGVLARQ